MKFIIIIVFLSIPSLSFPKDHYDEFNRWAGSSQYNSSIHIGAGALISGLTVYYAPKTFTPMQKWLLGTTMGIFAGCISEYIDHRYGYGWDNKDLAQWGIGGAMGASLITIKF